MYNEITLEKGLYNICGKTFTEALTDLDRDENYVGTDMEGLDAFERQLKRFDIKVSGAGSDRVEKFFKTTQSAVLFPEFVRRMIKQGMDSATILPAICSAVTYTDGVDYRGLAITKNGTDTAITAGNALPVTNVGYASSTVAIEKYGRAINTTYECLRKQRLDLFGVILKSVGEQIARAINAKACAVLETGATTVAATGADLTYADLAKFWASLGEHDMTTMLVSPATMAKILSFDEMKYWVGEYIENGVVKTPYGVTLVKCNGVDDDTAIGLDAGSALEMVLGSDVVVDNDKLISTQIDSIAFSISVGFAKVYPTAVKTLTF